MSEKKRIIVGITGASGMLFLKAFLNQFKGLPGIELHGICSESGEQVLAMESNIAKDDLPAVSKWFEADDFAAAPASGSSGYEAMIVLPCSMGTLAAIAGGLSINLIHRSADVILKERKKLILAVRETPFNRNHLQNMLTAHDAGAVICPTMPSYYFQPKTLEEAAESYSWRLMDLLGIEINDRKRWGE